MEFKNKIYLNRSLVKFLKDVWYISISNNITWVTVIHTQLEQMVICFLFNIVSYDMGMRTPPCSKRDELRNFHVDLYVL